MNLPSKLELIQMANDRAISSKVNSLISFLEEKFPQPDGDTPRCDKVGCNNFLYKGETYEHDGKEYCSPEHCLQSDEPKKKFDCPYCGTKGCKMCFRQVEDEPTDSYTVWKRENECARCGLLEGTHPVDKCPVFMSPATKPHWESDYAAIWQRWYREIKYTPEMIQQDILELIRKIVK